jgi:hypothetical protein
MSERPARINTFLTDANVQGPAIRLALKLGVQRLIRDVDTDVPCEIQDYDQCLTDYAIQQGYILVTGNVDDFAPKYTRLEQHPGAAFITPHHHRSYYHIAEWLKLLEDQDMSNQIVWI